jgi:hypothetical protein
MIVGGGCKGGGAYLYECVLYGHLDTSSPFSLFSLSLTLSLSLSLFVTLRLFVFPSFHARATIVNAIGGGGASGFLIFVYLNLGVLLYYSFPFLPIFCSFFSVFVFLFPSQYSHSSFHSFSSFSSLYLLLGNSSFAPSPYVFFLSSPFLSSLSSSPILFEIHFLPPFTPISFLPLLFSIFA